MKKLFIISRTPLTLLNLGCVALLYCRNLIQHVASVFTNSNRQYSKKIIITLSVFFITLQLHAQTVRLNDILDTIQTLNPTLKMYDAEIRSMDEQAKGAKAWMSPQLSTGFFMTPYNPSMWSKSKSSDGETQPGMGQYSIAGEQMIPNKSRLNAEYKYMSTMSTVEKEKKGASLNELYADAKRNYYEWLIIKKKLSILDDNEKLLNFMISNAEIRYKNGLEKISAYYKEKDINLTFLRQDLERTKLKPEFGIRYEHMFGFGGAPNLYTLMGMVRIPLARWSAKMYKANIEGLKWQAVSLDAQKQMLINEYSGMATGMKTEIDVKKKQVSLYENNIIPALRRNYQTMQLGYEQNTEELFMLYDAWETLNMTQLEYLDQLQQLLVMQTELERVLQIK